MKFKTFEIILLTVLLCPLSAAAEVELIGDVDNETRDELLLYFHNGARIFAGGYITDEFEPGLDKNIVSIERDGDSYTVTMSGRPCKRTEFYLIKICFRGGRCHWDLDSTYKCSRD